MWFAGEVPRIPAGGRPGALRPGFSLAPGLRVGLFGGSFNPAHAGHRHVAQTALTRLRLDRVIWLVTPQNPLKSARDLASLSARLDSARRQAVGPAMIVSDVETRTGVRYTVDALAVLQARFPAVSFVWIMGADGLADLHRWRGWTQIMAAAPVAVIARPGVMRTGLTAPAARRYAAARWPSRLAAHLPGATPPAWVYLDAPLNAASSTAIRRGSATAPRRTASSPSMAILRPSPQ